MRFISITCLLAISFNGLGQSPSHPLEKRSKITVKTAFIEANITLPATPTAKDCALNIEFKNVSSRNLQVPEFNGIPSCALSLKRPDGQLCQYGDLGVRLKSQREMLDVSGPMNLIAPGESKKWIVPLDQYFQLGAGQWSLDLSLDILMSINPVTDRSVPTLDVKDYSFYLLPEPKNAKQELGR